jgi:RimJ/RimL family protein N-acetyltransferase
MTLVPRVPSASFPPPDPPLSDGVISLRLHVPDDVPGIEQALNDTEIVRWLGKSTSTAAEFLEDKRQGWRDGTTAAFAICDADEQFVGQVFVKLGHAATAEVGYWLLPQARGHGHATRAVRLASRWALEDLGIARLQLWTEPENVPSQRVAERSGFVREGTLRSYREREGKRVDAIFYSLLPTDLT